MEPILKISNFSKRFRSQWTFRPIQAVSNLSLEVFPGESFGFLGHNGAGKTTTIKTIVGLIRKSAGSITFLGQELPNPAAHTDLGYLPEQPYFYDHLTVTETLDFFARLHNIPGAERKRRVQEMLELVGLSNRARQPVRSLSKGLQQRLGFGQAILNRPKLLLLDEPFSGLDPLGRIDIRNLILDLKRKGTTIVLSSHILSDVEEICDRVSIMANGKLQTVFSLRDTAKLFGESYELKLHCESISAADRISLNELSPNITTEMLAHGESFTLHFSCYSTATRAIQAALSLGLNIGKFQSKHPSLEEVFIRVTEAERKGAPTAGANL